MTATRSTSAPDEQATRPWRRFGPYALAVVAYLCAFAALPHDGFWICDNGAKFMQIHSLIEADYSDLAISWAGKAIDPAFHYCPLPAPFGHVQDDHLYCVFPPVFAFASSLPYRLFGFIGLYLLPLVAGLATLPAVRRLAGLLDAPRAAQPLAVVLVALATPMWFYSLTLWEHAPATCLVIWGVYHGLRHLLHKGAHGALASGLLIGIAIYLRDDLYLFAAAFGLVLLVGARPHLRTIGIYAIALIGSLLPLWAFQWLALGHPLGLHAAAQHPLALGWAEYVTARLPAVRALLLNVHARIWVSALVVGPALLLWAIFPCAGPRVARRLILPATIIALAIGLTELGGLLVAQSPIRWLPFANGFLAAAPVLVLAFVFTSRRDPRAGKCGAQLSIEFLIWLLVTVFAAMYILAAPVSIFAGIHWGCRFLLPAYPLLAILSAAALARAWQTRGPATRVMIGLVVALSMALQIQGLRLQHGMKSFNSELSSAVMERAERAVVSNVWFLPMSLGRCTPDKTFFLVAQRDDLARLSTPLRDAGHEQVLLILGHEPGAPVPAGGVVVHDGWLGFNHYVLMSVELE